MSLLELLKKHFGDVAHVGRIEKAAGEISEWLLNEVNQTLNNFRSEESLAKITTQVKVKQNQNQKESDTIDKALTIALSQSGNAPHN
ncbi:MAG: hypothetical protein OHK0017_08180 [Patescibacteria group bacterium]